MDLVARSLDQPGDVEDPLGVAHGGGDALPSEVPDGAVARELADSGGGALASGRQPWRERVPQRRCRRGEVICSGGLMGVLRGVQEPLGFFAPVEGDAEATELVGDGAVARGANTVDGPEVGVGDECVVDGFDGFELAQGGGHLAEVPQRLEPLRVARDRLDPGAHPTLQQPPGLRRCGP